LVFSKIFYKKLKKPIIAILVNKRLVRLSYNRNDSDFDFCFFIEKFLQKGRKGKIKKEGERKEKPLGRKRKTIGRKNLMERKGKGKKKKGKGKE
jgi:hypothetical protein